MRVTCYPLGSGTSSGMFSDTSPYTDVDQLNLTLLSNSEKSGSSTRYLILKCLNLGMYPYGQVRKNIKIADEDEIEPSKDVCT